MEMCELQHGRCLFSLRPSAGSVRTTGQACDATEVIVDRSPHVFLNNQPKFMGDTEERGCHLSLD